MMLDYLKIEGIRTGVISNSCFLGSALQDLLDRLLPNNQFEFVLTRSDYIFKKSHPMMFEIALQKAGLTADKVWYCGDSLEADVYGARNAGMFPVWYEGKAEDTDNPFTWQNVGAEPDFEHLHIRDWRELVEVLKGLKE